MTTAAPGRTTAWHRLGHDVSDAGTAAGALYIAGLNGWNVRKVPLYAEEIGPQYGTGVARMNVHNRWATIRTNPETGRPDYLGVVGRTYQPIQNEALASMMDVLTYESGAALETAGSMDGGARVFLTMRMPEALTIQLDDGHIDTTDYYIAAFNSHDGSSIMRLMVTPVRVMCCNMQTFALNKALSSVAIRHTESAQGRIDEIRHALGLVHQFTDEYNESVQRLIDIDMDHDRARIVFKDVFNVRDDQAEDMSDRTRNARLTHVEECVALLDAPTNANVAGTAYAALNAVTEHVDWTWRVRGADDQDTARAARVVAPAFIDVKSRAFRLLAGVN